MALGVVDENAVDGIDAAVDALSAGNPDHHLIVGGLELFVNGAAEIVIDADDGGAGLGLAVKDHLLGGDVVVHAGVTVLVVEADVQQHGDVEGDRTGQFELER